MSKRPVAKAAKPTDGASTVVKFQLETTLERFAKARSAFLTDLADALDIDSTAITIVDLRRGCVFVFVEFADLPEEALFTLLAVDAGLSPPDKLREVIDHYKVVSIREIEFFARPYITRFVQEFKKLERPGTRLTWMHLSDLHAREALPRGESHQDRIREQFVNEIHAAGIPVATGVFQAMMDVELTNQGPVTFILDSRKRF